MKRSFLVLSGTLFSLLIGIAAASAQDREVRTIKAGVLNGKAVSLPKPEYPAEAKKDNAEGAISVTVAIDEEGNVISATASEWQAVPKFNADGTMAAQPAHPLLREAAEKAAMGAKFPPTLLNGQGVKVTGEIIYNFVGPGEGSGANVPKIIDEGLLNGKATSLPAPVYPPAAKAVRAGGAVTILVVLDEQGSVISATAISGHPLLRAAATEAVAKATFSPTLYSGQPIKISGMVVYNFVAGTKPEDK